MARVSGVLGPPWDSLVLFHPCLVCVVFPGKWRSGAKKDGRKGKDGKWNRGAAKDAKIVLDEQGFEIVGATKKAVKAEKQEVKARKAAYAAEKAAASASASEGTEAAAPVAPAVADKPAPVAEKPAATGVIVPKSAVIAPPSVASKKERRAVNLFSVLDDEDGDE